MIGDRPWRIAPVRGTNFEIVAYDVWVNESWHGSLPTVRACVAYRDHLIEKGELKLKIRKPK